MSSVGDRDPNWFKLRVAWKNYYKSKQKKDESLIKVNAIAILDLQHKLIKAKSPYIKTLAIFQELLFIPEEVVA